MVRELANGAHAAGVFVDYTPAPEAKFPEQLEQAKERGGPEIAFQTRRSGATGTPHRCARRSMN